MASVGKWIDDNKSAERKLYEKGLARAGVDISNPFAKMKSMTMKYNSNNNSVDYSFDTGGSTVEQVFPDKKRKYIFEQCASFERQIGASRPMENVAGIKYYDGKKTYDVIGLNLVNEKVRLKGFNNDEWTSLRSPEEAEK